MAAGSDPHLVRHLVMQPIERAVVAPPSERGPDRAPRRQIMREAAPGTPRVQHRQQAVDNLPQVHRAGTTARLRRWQEGVEDGRLGIGQIRGRGLARHAPAYLTHFSHSLLELLGLSGGGVADHRRSQSRDEVATFCAVGAACGTSVSASSVANSIQRPSSSPD